MKKSRKSILLALLIVCMICPSEVWAWGQRGHRIIAEVAYKHMSKKAIKNVDNVLGKHGMVYWAMWADELKNDTLYLFRGSYDGRSNGANTAIGLSDLRLSRTMGRE